MITEQQSGDWTGNYLEGLSGPENPYLDPRHIAVAQSNQKLDIQGMTCGTRV